ncbi:MAG: MATE family efflux transporter [Lachnospiraceae bacterium]|nr:MATE family efflux transporter [Lachnospiraceae bacterium]
MAKNMTEGAVLPLILRFSVPLLLGNLVQQTYNLIDAAIVGRTLGENALAAVGGSSSIQFLVIGLCIGLCIGFGVPVAQRFGAKDYSRMRSYIFHSYILSIVIMAVLTLATTIGCAGILHLLQTAESIFEDAYAYLFVIFMGIPFTITYNLTSSILRAVGDSKTPFMFLVISAILNVFLDLLFIIVFHWGVMGAALATILSQGVSGVSCLAYMYKKFDFLRIRKEDMVWIPRRAKKLLNMGVPMGLQFSITAIGSMVMQSANNALGAVQIAGFSVALRIKQFAMCPFDAFASAVSTLAGQNYGAGNAKRIKEGILKGSAVGVIYGILIGIILIAFGRDLSTIFIKENSETASAVLDASARFLFVAGFFYWALGILNTTRLAAQGLGFSNLAIFSGVTEMVARISVVVFFVPKYKFDAICFADPTAWVTGAIYSTIICIYAIRKVKETLKQKDKAQNAVKGNIA